MEIVAKVMWCGRNNRDHMLHVFMMYFIFESNRSRFNNHNV